MKYISYLRVSTRKQDLGIDAQRTMIKNYLREDDEIVREFVEKETGTNKKIRPELMEALELCRNNGYMLLIAKLDRLSRNVNFITKLMDSEIKFKALDLPEANDLTITIFAALAQHEAKLISERTKAALAELKAKGVKLGGTYQLTDADRTKSAMAIKEKARLNPNTRTAKAFAILLKEKGYNYSQIAEELNIHGYKTPRGKEFWPKQAQRLFNEIVKESVDKI